MLFPLPDHSWLVYGAQARSSLIEDRYYLSKKKDWMFKGENKYQTVCAHCLKRDVLPSCIYLGKYKMTTTSAYSPREKMDGFILKAIRLYNERLSGKKDGDKEEGEKKDGDKEENKGEKKEETRDGEKRKEGKENEKKGENRRHHWLCSWLCSGLCSWLCSRSSQREEQKTITRVYPQLKQQRERPSGMIERWQEMTFSLDIQLDEHMSDKHLKIVANLPFMLPTSCPELF